MATALINSFQESHYEKEITTKPMLETAKENFIPLPLCESLKATHSNINRKELSDIPNCHSFILNNLLTPKECEFFIRECEKVGFGSLSNKFPTYYRVNDRILTLSHEMADAIFARIEPLLTRHDVIRIRPIGFGNEGTWRPIRLNECIKIMKYTSGGHFTPHFDGPWVPREDESSVYTVLIYLNTNYTGGETKFIDEKDRKHVYHKVKPCVGMGLIFNHDTFHEGTPVLKGVKYLLRTEMMFRRVDTQMIPNPLKYSQSESYNTALTLYRKSNLLEKVGDQEGFTDTYLRAISLQMAAQRSVSDEYYGELKRLTLPYELYIKIFSYLSAKDVVICMEVCKVWYDLAMDGGLWFELYKRRWSHGHKVDIYLSETPINPLVIDWYGNFKARIRMRSADRCAVIDMGGYNIRCANVLNKSGVVHTSEMRSVVARVPGIYDLHMRRGNYNRWFCGENALASYENECTQLVKRGLIDDISLLPEILYGLYIDCKIFPRTTSLLCLVNPLYCASVELNISYLLHVIYQHPCIRCTPQSVAVCVGNGTANGIVVNYGYESGWISLVSNCDSIACKEFELSIETEHVFTLIQQIVETAGLTNVNFCLYFIGGNLKDDLIHKLKQSYNKSKDYMKYIHKVVYNSNPNATLLAGAEYANSLKCNNLGIFDKNILQSIDVPGIGFPNIHHRYEYWEGKVLHNFESL
ncbi:hypothetical protein LOD99_8647 [Oopsacas minuta]|uniref:Fe2OG dioxygenase domain-containing protein n=1 Tax=Oopsacas minuta TaxID=111878 RepID=A0AAV7JFV8_9METZ|nr:hypothetical protein LOD99_8647 [Oopsacas minuta]